MLKELKLTNIVLVETAGISFGIGFNVLSGESGSGKSAIMNALNLIAGERSDTSLIRHGCNKGVVEAVFDISKNTDLLAMLTYAGITEPCDNLGEQELFIKREITANGKSRAFINHQPVQISFLKEIALYLFEIVGQHANQKLLSRSYHLNVLDTYGELQADVDAFYTSWQEETKILQQLKTLIGSEAERLKAIDVCHAEIQEIEKAHLVEGEEEDVFSEYTQLVNAEEIAQKLSEITQLFSHEKSAFLNQLNRQKLNFDYLVRLTPALKETADAYHNVIVELNEIAHTLHSFQHRIDYHPQRAEQLNDRLSLIARLKRKYAPSVSLINDYLHETRQKLHSLENADVQIEHFTEQHQLLLKQTQIKSENLLKKRLRLAKKLKKELEVQLKVLNMPKVLFEIEILPEKRSKFGDHSVEFYMIPNIGENKISICECASGGELSRLMLAIQAVIAGKEKIPTIIFDEIDANIGGETAGTVGELMKKIGRNHQVLCITHFPQVAIQADHHFRISKIESDGRTLTTVDHLTSQTKEVELMRMRGGI